MSAPSPRRLAVALPAVALLAAACDRGAAASSAAVVTAAAPILPAVRVEGGVRVLEHAPDALDRAPRYEMEAAPLAVLGQGSDEGTYDLTHAESVVPLRDGRVATFAAIGSRLLLFAADGRGERSLVRQGRGPGEITAAWGMIALAGDTLFLADPPNQRLNWVLPDQGVVQARGVADPRQLYNAGGPVGALPDGRVVMTNAGLLQRGVADSIVRRPTPIALLDPRDGGVHEIAQVPDLELVVIETRYRGRRGTSSTALRLGRRALVTVLDTFVVAGAGDGYQVELLATDGTPAARIRVPIARRAVTPAMRDTVIARELARLQLDGGGERLIDPEETRRQARENPFADSLPPYSRLFGTADGTLWVVDAVAPGDAAWSATAFRVDGAILGRLHVAGASSPMAFAGDRVIVRTVDADGVTSLRVHRLRAPGAPSPTR